MRRFETSVFLGILTIITFIILIRISTLNNPNIQCGVNGITEIRCIDGYKFMVDSTGRATQLLDSKGAIPCVSAEKP